MLYNLWLGLNIIYETLLPILWVLAILGFVWLALFVLGLLRVPKSNWSSGYRISGVLGLLAVVLMIGFGPQVSSSDFGDMGYWVDWAFLLGSAFAAGVVVFIATLPPFVWLSRLRS